MRISQKTLKISEIQPFSVLSKMISFWNENYFIESVLKILLKNSTEQKTTNQIPTFSTLAVFWNIIFCPNKIQNYQSLLGSYFTQLINGVCILTIKEKIARTSWGRYNYFILFHPDTIQEVLKSSVTINKDWLYDILHPWLGTGLLTSSDNKWRTRRKLLTPAFHFRILEDFQDIFNEQSNILIDKLKKIEENEIFDMAEIISLCTLDIIGDSAMGVHINAQGQSDNTYAEAINDVTASLVQWFVKPWYWIFPIFNLSPLGRRIKKNINLIHQFDRKVIKERKEKMIAENEDNHSMDNFDENKEIIGIKKRRAFLDLLLYHHLTHKNLDEEDIREEVATFMFEGHDTTAMGIVWTLYFLGLYDDIQERVFQELQEVFGNDMERMITTEDLKLLEYLGYVIKESIRLFPSVPFIVRKNSSDIKIDDYILPANSSIIIPICSLHRNPSVFENPVVFDPDRFLPENCQKRHPFAYIPFSAGPRNCIGQKFAMMEMKTVIANIIRHFKIRSLDPRDKIYETADIILRPKFGIRMNVKMRK